MYSRRPRKAVHACRKGVVLGQWHRNLCCFWSLREQASGSQVSRESASGCEVLRLCVSLNGEHSICIISWVRGACGMLWVWILFWDALLTRLYYTQCLSWVESFVVLTEVLLCADVLCCFVDASCLHWGWKCTMTLQYVTYFDGPPRFSSVSTQNPIQEPHPNK